MTRSDLVAWVPVWVPAIFIAGVIFLAFWAVAHLPTAQERFDACMAMAERAGLTEARAEDAGLICLESVWRRGGDGDGQAVAMNPSNPALSIILD